MNAQLTLKGEVAIVSLSGRVDIEKAASLKKACLQQIQTNKVVFCLTKLHFVGSSGIQSLFQLIEELKTSRGCEVKMAGLNPDFQRLWLYSQKNPLETHENLEKALLSFQAISVEIL